MAKLSLIFPSRDERFLTPPLGCSLIRVSGVIYLITNEVNGKQYVGQTTKGVKHRWRQYVCEVKHRPNNQIVVAAMAKYGLENFSVRVVAVVFCRNPLPVLNVLEPLIIAVLGTIAPTGYNLEKGGKNKGPLHPSTIAKLSLINQGRRPVLVPWTQERREHLGQLKRGNQYCKGSKLSLEAKAKISAARKGKSLSAEHRAKLSSAHIGKQGKKRGTPTSVETRAKISAALKGRNVRKERLEKTQRDNSLTG